MRQIFPDLARGKLFRVLEMRAREISYYMVYMRITSFSPFASPTVAPGAARVNSTGVPDTFAPAPTSTPATTTSPAGAGSAAVARGPMSVDMLMSISGSEGDREQRKRIAESAEKGLDHLEALHSDTLSGNIDPAKIKGLSTWLSDESAEVDPQMASIMRDISLRAKVELAKHEVSSRPTNV